MDDKRQKTQVRLALMSESKGEARKLTGRGTESPTAKHGSESLAEGQLMEQVCERENLKRALARVKRNQGSAGVDRMTVAELPGYLKVHWPEIRGRLLAGSINRNRSGESRSTSRGERTSASLASPVCSIASFNKRCCKCWSRSLSRHSRHSVTGSVRGVRRIRPWRWRKPISPKAIGGWSILTWRNF